jgi:acetyl esterase/lipase
MKIRNTVTVAIVQVFLSATVYGQRVISLWPGAAPGSENGVPPERTEQLPAAKLTFIYNVTQPTLTIYQPVKPNGTAVIVCPGGAFRFLSVVNEGTEVAQWLNKQGITAFVLKYRLVRTDEASNKQLQADLASGNFKRIDSVNAPVVPLAVADGRQAVTYVRQHAAAYKINPQRIGIMGFSAGGTLTASVAQTYTPASRPDFIAPIYAYTGAILGATVPPDAPPLFLALAGDDPIAAGNPDLYKKWRDAGRAAELHIYPQGGHGFGLRRQNLPIDHWADCFVDFMRAQGFLPKAE